MNNHIFLIKFDKPSVLLIDDYERLSENDKLKISSLEVSASYDYDDLFDKKYNCIMLTNPLIVDNYLKILDNNFIKYECIDITDNVVKHEVDLINDINIVEDKYDRYDIFMEELNDIIYNNLNIDLILDRISIVGMDGLSDIEKKFLEIKNL